VNDDRDVKITPSTGQINLQSSNRVGAPWCCIRARKLEAVAQRHFREIVMRASLEFSDDIPLVERRTHQGLVIDA
jgi:hypothetical protein